MFSAAHNKMQLVHACAVAAPVRARPSLVETNSRRFAAAATRWGALLLVGFTLIARAQTLPTHYRVTNNLPSVTGGLTQQRLAEKLTPVARTYFP